MKIVMYLPDVYRTAALGFLSNPRLRSVIFLIGFIYAVHLFVWFVWFSYRMTDWERDYRKASSKRRRFMEHVRRDWILRALPFFFLIVPIYWMIVRGKRRKHDGREKTDVE